MITCRYIIIINNILISSINYGLIKTIDYLEQFYFLNN